MTATKNSRMDSNAWPFPNRLWLDQEDARFHIGAYALHCGDCFEVQIEGVWHQVRIEHTSSSEIDNGWYLIGAPWEKFPNSPSIIGLPARREAA